MSKAGVAKTQEFRKPRKCKKVKLEERVIDGEVVVGKECSKCGEWKPLDSGFHKDKSCLGGMASRCKECKCKYTLKWQKENSEKCAIKNLKWRHENKEKESERVRKWREENKERYTDSQRKYREKNKEAIKEAQRKWYEDNKDTVIEKSIKRNRENKGRHRESTKKWRMKNKELMSVYKQRRRARKKALPATWTPEQKEEMLEYFGRKCALTGERNITEEHAIPLSIGHGGTIHGNMWPLCSRLNSSKYNKNIFEWFVSNRQRFELSQEKFDRLIEWLATANDMTVEEYRDYVYWCHAHPNDVLENEAI